MNDLLSQVPESWKSAALFVMLGALGGTWFYGELGGFRADPFTGEQGAALAERITKLEDRQPVTYPPPEWQIWRQTVTGQLDAIRVDDRHARDELAQVKKQCNAHEAEAVEWKMRIKSNEDSISNLWKWYNYGKE